MKRVLVDTGPLVALLSASDSAHANCAEVWKSIPPPLYTCWPVLTEAAWMLRLKPRAVETLLLGGVQGVFKLLPLTEEDGAGISAILTRYREIRPQLADAALVHLAEREGIETVFTLHQRDFRVFRIAGKRRFNILP